MKKIVQENKIPLALYLLFLCCCICGLLLLNKAELHLFLNQVHSRPLDIFFQGVTFLGEWFPFLVIALIMIYRFGPGAGALAAQLLSALVTQLVKHICGAPRPRTYFSENFPGVTLPLPEGFSPHVSNSFPSGHTSSIFALLVFMILMTKNNYLKVFYLVIAILVGYSRIYLSQHFALDVTVGSLIGTLSAVLMWYLIPQEKKWARYSLFDRLVGKKKD